MPRTKLSTKEFITRATNIHGDTYEYSKTKYVGATTKVSISCFKHGRFLQLPTNHLKGSGCPSCGTMKMQKSLTSTKVDFVNKANQVHGNKYAYPKVTFSKTTDKVEIICKVHGSFYQRASDHLSGAGCQTCGGRPHVNTTSFIKRAKEIHGNTYLYESILYVGCNTKVIITCKTHGDFSQTPSSHLAGHGCPGCRAKTHSKIAIQWIEDYAYSHRLKNVRHAENGGEFLIPGVGKVDGYHPQSNTVFEFHGSNWHGDPNIFKPHAHPNHFRPKATAKRLLKETLEREQKIRNLGYNLIVMWQSQYQNSL